MGKRGRRRGPDLRSKHVRAVDKYIKVAYREAQRRVELIDSPFEIRIGHTDPVTGKGKPYTHSFLTQFYHEEMNKMTKKAGLRT